MANKKLKLLQMLQFFLVKWRCTSDYTVLLKHACFEYVEILCIYQITKKATHFMTDQKKKIPDKDLLDTGENGQQHFFPKLFFYFK